MHVKTILNRLYKQRGFVYGEAEWCRESGRAALRVPVRARANSQPICAGCRRPGPGYDRLPERTFQFVPLWGLAVFFLYGLRRVACPRCGVTVEKVPWARGKEHQTTAFQW